jgi:hypothetical protein
VITPPSRPRKRADETELNVIVTILI